MTRNQTIDWQVRLLLITLFTFFINFAIGAAQNTICDDFMTSSEGESVYMLHCKVQPIEYSWTYVESENDALSDASIQRLSQDIAKQASDLRRFLGGAGTNTVPVICYNEVVCASVGTEIFITYHPTNPNLFVILCNAEDFPGQEYSKFIRVIVQEVQLFQIVR